jgi:hypothetical protein
MVTNLSINLADPQEVRAKMPEIKGLLADARQELRTLEDQVELLARIVGEKASVSAATATSGGRSTSGRGRKTSKRRVQKAAPSQERAIEALQRAGRPMGPADLFRFMEAEGFKKPASVSALNALLWAASKAGRVVKGADNTYTPSGGFPVDHSLMNDTVGVNETPSPARLSGFAPPTAVQQASPNGVEPPGEGREQSFEVGTR